MMRNATAPPGELSRLLERLHADLDVLSYYNLLGVPPDASEQVIRSAFHARALLLHPDRYTDPAQRNLRDPASALYKRMAEAMRILSDPRLRSDYDALLARGEVRYTSEGVDALRRQAAATSPEERTAILNPQAAQFYGLGRRELRRQAFDQATRYLEQALSLEPASAKIRASLQEARRLMRLYQGSP